MILNISDKILNSGLSMAIGFGPNFNQPVNQRLKDQFPELTNEELDEINQLCYAVRDEGVNFIYNTLGSIAGKKEKISGTQLETSLKEYLSKYLWISKENLGSIFSQGCYYAWKDGSIEALAE